MASDFKTRITVEQTPEAVFAAINHVNRWWSEEVVGVTDVVNGEFLYHYQNIHICKFRVEKLITGRHVEWTVLDNYFSFLEGNKEWNGTKVVFVISSTDGKTTLDFTHVGLVPEDACYNVCRDGWKQYIDGSLYKLITTGKGEPNPAEGGFNQQLLETYFGDRG